MKKMALGSTRRKGFAPYALDLLVLATLCAGLWYIAHGSLEALPQQWEWQRVTMYIAWQDGEGWHTGLLLKGLGATLRLGLWSGLLALLLGTIMGIRMATSKERDASLLQGLVIVLRNTPPLVLLFLLYFFASQSLFPGLEDGVRNAPVLIRQILTLIFAPPEQVDRMMAAVLTLGLYEGAYVAEIVRAGLQSLPQSQADAAAALGFSPWQRLRLVLLPQALPLMLPPLTGQCVSTFKDSALASLISVPELTFQGMEVMAVTRLPFESWALVGLLYLGLSLVCTSLLGRAEKSLRWRKGT